MMLELYTLKDFPARVSCEEDANNLDLQVYGIKYRSRAQIDLDIIKSETVYLCSGRVSLDVEWECSRCLEYYPDTLQGEIDFSIRETKGEISFDRSEVPENQIIIPEGTTRVSISDPVREALILEVPLKPLCAEDCKGLCPCCGGNRNEQECRCTVDTADSRWNGLRKLR